MSKIDLKQNNSVSYLRFHVFPKRILYLKAADLQMLKKNKKNNGKYWPSYVQWRKLLLLTPSFK